jgi:hypothetical protein
MVLRSFSMRIRFLMMFPLLTEYKEAVTRFRPFVVIEPAPAEDSPGFVAADMRF